MERKIPRIEEDPAAPSPPAPLPQSALPIASVVLESSKRASSGLAALSAPPIASVTIASVTVSAVTLSASRLSASRLSAVTLSALTLSALTITSVTIAALAWGHGPAPSALRLLVGGEPLIVQTSIGLAIDEGQGRFRYGCPSQWGGLETPLVAALGASGGDTAILVAGQGAFVESLDGGCDFSPVEDPIGVDVAGVTALEPARGEVWGAARAEEGGSTIFVWRPEAPLALAHRSALRVDSLASVGDHVLAAGARPAPAILRLPVGSTLPLEPSDLEEVAAIFPTREGLQRLSLRRVDTRDGGAQIELVATTGGGLQWWRSTDGGASFEVVLGAALSLHGPAPICGGLVAVADGRLVADPSRPPACDLGALDGRLLTCLGERDGLVWACEDRSLIEINEDAGALTTSPLFALEQIEGPGATCPTTEAARLECRQDWIHFGAEANLINPDDPFGEGPPGVEPEDTSGDDAGPQQPAARPGKAGGGCSISGGTAPPHLGEVAPLIALALAAVACRQRSRPRIG